MHESMKQKVRNVTRTQHYIHYSTLITDTSTKYDPALRSGTDKQTKLRPARVSEHTLALGRQGEEHKHNHIISVSYLRAQSPNEHIHTLLSVIPAV